MAATLKGRLTRSVNTLRKLLDECEEKERDVCKRAQEHDETLVPELNIWIVKLEAAMTTCETNLSNMIKYVSELPDSTRKTEDDKLTEMITAENGLENTMEAARENLITRRLLINKLSRNANSQVDVATDANNQGRSTSSIAEQQDGQIGIHQSARVIQRRPNIAEESTLTANDGTPMNNTTSERTAMHQDLRNFLRTDSTRLHLPLFDGRKGDFLRFWSLFEVSVDGNSDLNETVKLHILLSHLKGDAARLVAGFAFHPRNYNAVKQTLQDRYASKEKLERQLYEDLYSIRCNARNEFPVFVDQLENILNQMSTFAIDVETEGIRMAVETALPQWVRPHIFQSQLLIEKWTTSALRAILKKIALIPDQSRKTSSEELLTVVPIHQKPKWKRATSVERNAREGQPTSFIKKREPFTKQMSKGPSKFHKEPKTNVNTRRSFNSDLICEFCNKIGHLEEDCFKKRRMMKPQQHVNTAMETLQQMSPIPIVSSVVEQQETPLMLIEAPTINLKNGNRSRALLFFDSGSQVNFTSTKLAEALDLNLPPHQMMTVKCFGGAKRKMRSANTELGIQQLDGQVITVKTKCVEQVVGNLPMIRINPNNSLSRELRIPSLLIGNKDMWKFIRGPTSETVGGYQCITSTLGTLLGGPVESTKDTLSMPIAAIAIDSQTLDKQLEEWTSLETIGIREPIEDDEDERAWILLKEKIKFENGRYHVPLPFKDENPKMTTNLGLCIKQMIANQKRMNSKPIMMQSADNIVKEWLENGVIEEVPNREITFPEGIITVYSPFHLVEKPSSRSTPVRLVHNGSASLKGSPSLNKLLSRGPVFMSNMIGVMLRFREDKVVATGDISKAFLQLCLQKEYRDALRFIYPRNWKEPINTSNIIHYRFRRINFGLSCSPFLLAGALKIHFENKKPYGNEILLDSYVDNLTFRGNTAEEVQSKMEFAKDQLQQIGMKLSQFTSSDKRLQHIWKQTSQQNSFLGISWNTEHDKIIFKFDEIDLQRLTKRSLLSQLCRRFDPLGLTFPSLLKWKLAVQGLWKQKKEWDQLVNSEDIQNLQRLNEHCPTISMSRNVCTSKQVHLVIFVDASKDAFAATSYYVAANEKPQLVMCRARLTPIRGSTIPKLELLAALLGVRLAKFIETQTTKDIQRVTLFGDSMVVLHWILNNDCAVPRFNQKRLDEIRTLKDADFRYVNTKENPADYATRGCSGTELAKNDLWWHGPKFLELPYNQWPHHKIMVKDAAEEDRLEVVSTTIPTPDALLDVSRFSKFNSAISTMIVVMLFIRKTLPKKRFMWNPVHQAKAHLLKESQQRFPPTKEQQHNLRLFKDTDDLWRSQGRIQNSDLTENAKHPIFLAKSDYLTKLLILHVHDSCSHASINTTLAQIRLEYWIPSGRATVKKTLKDCMQCRRRKPPPFALPTPPQLPGTRVRESTPFAHCGCDLAGPFQVKLECGDITKIWIVLFTCFSSRAIHAEVALGLSSPHLLRCIRKFVARRGRPSSIWTDNATNFKGALNVVKTWKDEDGEVGYCEPLEIKWYFIPSLSPWVGGVYERMIALIKQTLRRSIPRKLLSLDEMTTFVTEAEAVVNCRPLTYISDDSIILRPVDLICPRIKPGIPFVSTDETNEGFNETPIENMWIDAKLRISRFWDVWKADYLIMLRERTRSGLKQPRSLAHRTPQVGEMVLLEEPNLTSTQWRLARITAVHPGEDGLIRSAEVRTGTGRITRRSIATIHPLELGTRDSIAYQEKTPNTKEKTQTEPKDKLETTSTTQQYQKGGHNLRTRKPIRYAFYVLTLCLFVSATATDCPPHAKVVTRQNCQKIGFAIGKINGNYCWRNITCQQGMIQPPRQLDNFTNNPCGKDCACPQWSIGCVFTVPTKKEKRDNFKLLHLVRPDFRTTPIDEDDRPVQQQVPLVMLPDRSIHYVRELNIALIQGTEPPAECFGTGEVTGDSTYCSTHPCVQNGTRICLTNLLESAVLRTPAGDIPILAWGTKNLTIYTPILKETSNCQIELQCHPKGGISITRNKECIFKYMETCIRDTCRQTDMKPNHVQPPRNLLLSEQPYEVRLWKNGKIITQTHKLCPALDVCELKRCHLCMETIRNYQCFLKTIATGIITLILIIAILLAAKRKCRKPRRRTTNTRILELLPLLLVTISSSNACGTAATFQATSENCELTINGATTCHFDETTLLTVKNDVESCLVFNDRKGTTMSRLRIEAELQHVCTPRTMFYTRPMTTTTYTVRRCPGLGSCKNDNCLQTSTNSTIKEFEKINQFIGVTRCEESCGGLGCGCLTFGSGCRFSRTITNIDPNQQSITIFECNWEKTILLKMEEETATTLRKKTILLRPGETSKEETFNLTISVHQVSFSRENPLERYFSRNSTEVARLSEHELHSAGILKCKTPNETTACHLNPGQISCRTADGIVSCQPAGNEALIESLQSNKLPIFNDGRHYVIKEHLIAAEDRGSVTLQLQTSGYTTTLLTEMSSCEMRKITIQGCFGCHEGAQVDYECTTNFGRHIGEVKCPSQSFSIICGPGEPRTTFVNFDNADIDEQCELRCPGSSSNLHLTARLSFIAEEDDDWRINHEEIYVSTNFISDIYNVVTETFKDYVLKTETAIIFLIILYIVVKLLFRCIF